MLMALNRQMLHNSLLRVQQHIASTGNTFKVAALNAMGNANEPNHHTIRKGSSFHQHSSSSDSEDETLKKNPYYTAYAEKLRALKNKDTVAYREALKRIKSREHQTTGNTVCVNEKTTLDIAPEQMDDCAPKVQPKPNRRPSQTQLLKPKMLDKVLNVDLLHGKSWRDVTEIWLAYHRNRDETLSAVIPLNQFDQFYNQSIKYPMFILPLPRNTSGYEFMFAQFLHYQEHSTSNCSVHITPLISYQTYKENAPECMTVEYYTDLCNGHKNIVNENSNDESCVLMRATYNGKLLSAAEAACLVNQLRIFYGTNSGDSRTEKLLKLFNEGSSEFKHSDIIALVETLSIS